MTSRTIIEREYIKSCFGTITPRPTSPVPAPLPIPFPPHPIPIPVPEPTPQPPVIWFKGYSGFFYLLINNIYVPSVL